MIAISVAHHIDLTYGSDQETEKAYQQYVSGWMFDSFGIRPALGRVFSENDDLTAWRAPLRRTLLRLLEAAFRRGSERGRADFPDG